jgi:hypothetical protein
MKHIKLYEEFVNEATNEITLNDSEVDTIFNEIVRLTNIAKERGYVPGVVAAGAIKTPSSNDSMVDASGEFGENPNNKKFKISTITANNFYILATITSTDGKPVCYVTFPYDVKKKSIWSKEVNMHFYTGNEKAFSKVKRNHETIVY